MQRKTGPRLSAGIIPVYKQGSEVLLLLLRSYNYWDFPKGEVEPGEKPLQAARRELQEETGISHVEFPFGDLYTETPPYSQGKVARYYIGEVKTRDVILGMNEALGRPEHHEFRWVTLEEAQSLLGTRVLEVLRWAQGQLSSRSRFQSEKNVSK